MIRSSKITFSTFTLALLFCLGGDVFACSCVTPGPPCQEYWRADAVFVGLVKAKEVKDEVSKTPSGEEVIRLDAEVRVTFTITDAFRGVTGKEVDIFTNNSSAACGYNFERDRRYIVYAYEYPKGGGKLHTSICSRTQMYSQSGPDIAYAKSLAKAQPGAVISGVVILSRQVAGRDSTIPLANGRVIVIGKDKQDVAVTDDEGRYKTHTLPAGDYIVMAEPPKGMSAWKRKITVADAECAEVSFWLLWDGRLSGTVFDADGQPATGARIQLVRVRNNSQHWVNQGQSEENGQYEVKGIQPGRYRVALQHIGLNAATPQTIFYHPGVYDPERADVISFGEEQIISHFALRLPQMPRQKTVEGIVLGADGRPLAGVLVNHGQPNENLTSNVKTDDDGRFSFQVYEGVQYSVRVIIDLGNGEYAYFKWGAAPADAEKTPLKIVIDPNRPEYKERLN